MTQRLIYGKTVRIQGDSVIIDTADLQLDVNNLDLDGPMTMDPFDPTGVIPPIKFSKTARQSLLIAAVGLTAAKNIKVEATRNDNFVTLVFPSDLLLTFTPSLGSFTFTIPAPYVGGTSATLIYANVIVRNLTTASEQTVQFTLNPQNGAATISVITGGQNYDWRYGMPTIAYRL